MQEWNERGMTSTSGGPWRVNSLSSLLLQPRLAGSDGVPAILDDGTSAQLRALHLTRRKGPRRATRRYLLTSLLRCWRCGGGLRGMPRSGRADLYVCPGPPHGGCSGTAVTADHADDAVRDMVLERLDSPDLATLTSSGGVGASAHRASMRHSAGELDAHRRRLEDLADMWASGEISRSEWLALKRNLGGRTRAVEVEAARLARVDALRDLAGTGHILRGNWTNMSVDQRRALLRATLDHVVVLAATPPKQVFRPERLQPHWLA